MAGLAVALLDAIARDLRVHHVAIVAALSLAEAAVLTAIEPSILPGVNDGSLDASGKVVEADRHAIPFCCCSSALAATAVASRGCVFQGVDLLDCPHR